MYIYIYTHIYIDGQENKKLQRCKLHIPEMQVHTHSKCISHVHQVIMTVKAVWIHV